MHVFETQRLIRDYKRMQKDPPQGISASPNESNLMAWNAVIFGPEETVWDGGEVEWRCEISRWARRTCRILPVRPGSGADWITVRLNVWLDGPTIRTTRLGGLLEGTGTFKLTLQFTEEYPNKAPTVRFLSKMFHPNSTLSTTNVDVPIVSCR